MWPFKRRRKPIEEIYSLIEELPQKSESKPELTVVVTPPPTPIIVPMDNPRAQAMRDYEMALAAHQQQIDNLKEAGGA